MQDRGKEAVRLCEQITSHAFGDIVSVSTAVIRKHTLTVPIESRLHFTQQGSSSSPNNRQTFRSLTSCRLISPPYPNATQSRPVKWSVSKRDRRR